MRKVVREDPFMRLGRNLSLAFLVGLATVPLALLALWSFSRSWFWPSLAPGEWSIRAWSYIMSPTAEVRPALVTSLGLAATVTFVSLLIGVPAARVLALYEFRGKRVILFSLLLPVLAPPLASAMGVHTLFLRYGLSDQWIGVMLVHLIPAVPYVTLVLAGSFSRFDPEYEAQARTLGAGTFSVWRYVTLPAIAPGMAVAAVFAFLISWSQYLLTLLVGGSRIRTLPLILVAFQRSGDEAITSALSLVFIAPAIIVFAIASRFLKHDVIHEATRRTNEE